MPPIYILLHLALGALCFWGALRLPPRPALRNLVGVATLGLVVLGFAIERLPAWSWNAIGLRVPDLVFVVNVSLEGVLVLCGLMISGAQAQSGKDKYAKLRAAVLSLPLVGAALWSYAWYFSPLPPNLHGKMDKKFFCAQTSDDSCSPSAAVILLHQHGLAATELEMARLCLTRYKQGTPPLGLYRGLAVRAAERGLRPRLVTLRHPREFHRLGRAAIVAIGVKNDAPHDIKLKMENYGWNPGQRHAVVILRGDAKGQWLDVADPTYGRERWPTKDIQYLWDGKAIILQ